ncbi:MAG: bifunctional oligoribonuclease/PAP phosphatase NrnA [Halanaerobiales bacterium]|nr:bifunctional oligoribonuclease/PAP phosphatase NrnA [Halanaerobiales bacterium]
MMMEKTNVLNENTLKEIAELINNHQQFVITGHIDPDGDCVGSMLGLGTALKKLGKKVRLVLEKPLTGNAKPLKDEWDFVYLPDFTFEPEDELFIAIDSGDLGRVPNFPEHDLTIVNIDHHMTNSFYGNYNYVDVNAAAAGEIIYSLINEMGVQITREIGYYLTVAIICDTGCFRYSNTNANILKIVASFIEMGIDTSRIYKEFLGTHPLAKLQIKGLVYSKMERAFDGRVAWVTIDNKMLKEANATIDDVYGIAGDLRDIEGVEVGFSVLEREPGLIQLGFRSNYYVPVNKVAEAFGGGGHLRASGASFEGDIESLPDKILKKIAEYLE